MAGSAMALSHQRTPIIMKTPAVLFSIALLILFAAPRPAAADDIVVRAVTLPAAEHPVTAQLFTAPGKNKRPAVIILHGRQGIDRFSDSYQRYAMAVAQSGMDAYLLPYYDDADKAQAVAGDAAAHQTFFTNRVEAWTLLVRDVVNDIRAGKQNSGLIGLLGFSQGAFLATAVASQDSGIAALVVYYGGIPSLFRETITHLPPLLVLHGDADTLVPLAEGQALADLGRTLGQPAVMTVFPGAGHGFTGEDAAKAQQEALAFLHKQLFPKHP
jgi:carboxymethylenebutenolidase